MSFTWNEYGRPAINTTFAMAAEIAAGKNHPLINSTTQSTTHPLTYPPNHPPTNPLTHQYDHPSNLHGHQSDLALSLASIDNPTTRPAMFTHLTEKCRVSYICRHVSYPRLNTASTVFMLFMEYLHSFISELHDQSVNRRATLYVLLLDILKK